MSDQVAYVAFSGGLDLVTPPTQMAPGSLLSGVNVECPLDGGYRQVDGYEKIGATLPGEGPVLGVVAYKSSIFALRANVGAAAATLYRWSGSLWSVISASMPVGRYSFDIGNFSGMSSSRTLFMVCSGGKPWMYDGTTLTELSAAMTGAQWVKVHSQHLFIGFDNGSLQWSATTDPASWDALGGAGEVGVGDNITGLAATAEGVLMVFCRDSISALYGTSEVDFQLKSFVAGAGVRPYTVVSMQAPFFVGDRGMGSLFTVASAGDFAMGDWGRQIEPLFKSAAFSPVAAIVSKTKNQYRVFDATGQGVIATVVGDQVRGITLLKLAHSVACARGGEFDDGTEVLLFGDADGNVFRLDQGNSFAGQDIASAFTCAANHFGSPTVRKRYRRFFLDLRGVTSRGVAANLLPIIDGGSDLVGRHRVIGAELPVTGGLWDAVQWDQFAWSGSVTPDAPISMAGTGHNFALLIQHTRNGTPPFSVYGYTMHYAPRRLRRG